jgi:hypothetical protein
MPDPNYKFPFIVRPFLSLSRASCQGVFDWPKDPNLEPLKVLGMSLEDLDPIRRDCKVYILYSRNFSVSAYFTLNPNKRHCVSLAMIPTSSRRP